MFGSSIQCNYFEVRHVVGCMNNSLLFTNTFFVHTREENEDGGAAPNPKDDGRAGPEPGPSLLPGPLTTHFTRGFENLLTQVELHSFSFKSLLPASLRQEHRATPKAKRIPSRTLNSTYRSAFKEIKRRFIHPLVTACQPCARHHAG